MLNSNLYDALCAVYHNDVKIAREGERAHLRHVKQLGQDRHGKDRYELVFDDRGEQYRLCCPICGDTRYRLYVSYLYGQRDAKTGRVLTQLINCRNEDCYEDPQRRDLFYQQLQARVPLDRVTVRESRETPVERMVEKDWPGPVAPLAELPAGHPAREYLLAKFHHDEQLFAAVCGRYDLRFCTESLMKPAARRIIIPYYYDQKLLGWQARYVGEVTPELKQRGITKYWTCPGTPLSRFFYNIDYARHYRTIVIVEGCRDVWAFGPMAVGLSGHTLSRGRVDLLAKRCPENVVLMLDEDACRQDDEGNYQDPAFEATWDRLQEAFPQRCCLIKLPHGTDPADHDRRFLREYVRQQATHQGLTVSYERKASE